MAIATVAELLANLRSYRQLSQEQLDALARESVPADVRSLGRTLVQRGWLTTYQINELFLGRGRQLLLGSYVLLELLGEGGMGQVFKARNWKLGQIVALKLIRKERLSNPDAIKRFYREIRAAAQLEHPNIVRAFDADEVEGTHFFVMEFVEGTDLHKVVKSQGPLDVRRACDYVRQAALGLQHAHERGLVHRDIKPHNLLLVSGPQVKILDMGLARIDAAADDGRSSTMTQEGTVMGTPDYIAPEQGIDSHAVDIRADLYSLGCTLYYLLAGRTPFAGGTFVEKLLKHRQQPAMPLEQFRDDVPDSVSAVVRKLMAKRPEHRFQTPGELASVLQEILQGGTVPVDTGPPPAAVARPLPSGPFSALNRQDSPGSSTVKMNSGAKLRARLVWIGSSAAVLVVIALLATTLFRKTPPKQTTSELPVVAKARFTVDGSRPWQDTGIALERGSDVTISARGRWEKKGWPESTPAGIEDLPRTRNVLPEAPPMCLLGRIGDQDPPFIIGNSRSLRAKEAGRLFVQANTLDVTAVRGEIVLDVAGASRTTSPAPRPAPTQIEIAEAACANLRKQPARTPVELLALNKAIMQVRGKFTGTWQAGQAAFLGGQARARLPSQLDKLDPAKLTDDAVAVWRAQRRAPPPELVAVLGTTPAGHASNVNRAVYSPDGKWLVSSGSDLRLWDPRTMRLRWLDREHVAGSPAFTGDGKTLVTAGGYEIRLWDLSGMEPREKQLLRQKDVAVGVVDISRDGKLLAAGGSDLAIRIWQLAADGPKLWDVLKGHTSHLDCVYFSPDGRLLASGSHDKTVRLWDLTGKQPKLFAELKGHGDWVYHLAFSPDSKVLASAGAHDRRVILWDLKGEPKQAAAHGLSSATCSVAFSPDGKMLAIGLWSGELVLWDMMDATARFRCAVQAHNQMIWAVPFSPDGKRLATGGQDGLIHQWDVTGKLPVEVPPPPGGHRGRINSLAISADDRHVLTTSEEDRSVRLWDVVAGKEVRQISIPDKVAAVAFSPAGPLALGACADSSLLLWSLETGQLVQKWQGHTSAPRSVVFSDDGRSALSAGGWDGSVRLWEVATGKELHRFEGHTAEVVAAALSPDGRTVASAGNDKTLRLWDVTGREKQEHAILRSFTSAVTCAGFSPDGTLLAAGTAGLQLRVFDLRAGMPKELVAVTAGGPVTAVAFASDGRYLATADSAGYVIIWNQDTGQKIRELQLPEPVSALAIALDSRHVAVASTRGAIYLLRILPAVPAEGMATPYERGRPSRL